MNQLKKVAIIGRPNVGKSALFNCICKKRHAIVDEKEGVTKDRLYQIVDSFGYPFEVIDTGGIDPKGKAAFSKEIKQQAEIAIEEADSIIFVVDATCGIQELDSVVAKILHKCKKHVTLAVNKVDSKEREPLLHQFHPLGFSDVVAVSATQGYQIAELMEHALSTFDKSIIPEVLERKIPNVAICGRTNVGKSLLFNALVGSERCIVSPIAGTTTDSIDTPIRWGDKDYILIDTAGIRRKQKEKDAVEKFAAIRTERVIERADICLLIIDVMQGMTHEEKKIAQRIEEEGKGLILIFNKWDLTKGFRMEHCLKELESEIPFLKHCPKLFISALTKRNIDQIFPTVDLVFEAYGKRVTTGILNKFLITCMQKYHPPMIGGKRLRVYYMAQIDVRPPKFVLFVNNPNLMDDTYKKYITNSMRAEFPFDGVPFVISLRAKKQRTRHHHVTSGKENKTFDRDLVHLIDAGEIDDE